MPYKIVPDLIFGMSEESVRGRPVLGFRVGVGPGSDRLTRWVRGRPGIGPWSARLTRLESARDWSGAEPSHEVGPD